MKAWVETLIFAVVMLFIFACGSWWAVYKYHDCKRVGHTTLYCVLDIGH